MLLSAGIPVEVCKVKAKEATAAQIEKARKRKAESGNGWNAVKWEMSEAKEDVKDEEEEEEQVGHWERSGKRVRVD